MKLEEIAGWLRSHDNYTILTHRRPDGDAVGSAVALCAGLRKLGKQAMLYKNPQITERYLPMTEGMLSETVTDCVVAVDLASESLFPYGFEGKVQCCIDHHGSNTGYAENLYVDAHAAACGEIIFRLLQLLAVPVDPGMANALYAAISTDCGCFRYSNTTPDTLRITASLMECGADTVSLNRMLFEEKTKARFALEAYLTNGMRLFGGGKIAVCFLKEADRLAMGVTEDDADSIAGFSRNLVGVEVGAMLRDLPDGQIRVSLRTDSRLRNASAICVRLGGGGHAAAAGATAPGGFDRALEVLLEAIHAETGLDTAEVL